METSENAPLAPVAARLVEEPSGAMELILDLLASADSNVAQVMPYDGTSVLFSILRTVLLRADEHGRIDEHTQQQLAELAWRVDEYGFTPYDYQQLGRALHVVMEQVCADLGFAQVLAACRVVTSACAILSAHATDMPPISAEVVEVERRCRQVIVVRLITNQPLDYGSAQFVEVSTDYVQNRWVPVTPSIPTNEAGMLEVHLFMDKDRNDPYRSLLANPRPGDTWRVTNGFGGVDTHDDRDLLFAAHGTGLAAARAMILEHQMHNSNPPRVHLFVSADYPGELYDLLGLWQLAASCPWLSVVPIVRNDTDEWWVGATEHSKPPRGLHLLQTGEPGNIIASYGSWADRDVYIFGPYSHCESVRAAMIAAGTPAENIYSQSFSHGDRFGEVADLITKDVSAPSIPAISAHASIEALPASPFEFVAQFGSNVPAQPPVTLDSNGYAPDTEANALHEDLIPDLIDAPTTEDLTATASAPAAAPAAEDETSTPQSQPPSGGEPDESHITVVVEDHRMVVPMSAMFELATPATQNSDDTPLVDLFADAPADAEGLKEPQETANGDGVGKAGDKKGTNPDPSHPDRF